MSIYKETININDLKLIRSLSDESMYKFLEFLLADETEWKIAKAYLDVCRRSLRPPVPLQEIDVAISRKKR